MYTPSLPSPRMPGHPATRSQGLPNSMFVLPNLTHPAQRPQPPPMSQSQQGVQRLTMPYAYGTGANAQPIGDSSNAMSTGTYGRNERGYLQKLMVRIKLTELIGAVGKFESQGDKRTDPIKWLKELRLTLPGYAIDEIEYGVVIGQLMADTSQKEWCTNNLAYKPWDEVITLFCEHFQGAAALQKLRQEYTALHQHANEEVFRLQHVLRISLIQYATMLMIAQCWNMYVSACVLQFKPKWLELGVTIINICHCMINVIILGTSW